MLIHPQIDPVIFKIGPFEARWYGLMYVISFFCVLMLTRYQLKERALTNLYPFLENLLFYSFLGLIIGARLGFCFFYYPDYFLTHPWEIIAVWKGGMSFHGGLIGGLLTGYVYVKSKGQSFLWWADLIAVCAPIGLFFGRIGNFINGEIYGKPTSLPWGMVFPEGGPVPRHPVQVYEGLVTGLLLFLFLWSLRKRDWAPGTKFAIFMISYGILRFLFEFLREPAQSFDLIFGWMTMGQVLCLGMIAAGGLLLYLVKRQGFQKVF
ncbi:prolipoprotein diacylglyceryl transferase [Thermodesulfobacterium sp. TA1]|uniref:prolipoprotein diacylglyceryl transferase n=1 Tax=Thermodesulfobacterium sp. TA1 TaxID=2234087 RepID=UPI001231AF8E|nr:prolipoprotein diacylglyceryl transferase [Thermodesulfobacterium sp. TA1]QER41684.1 prolipoprotein diacylglyceryl transferase [Thermodesulfobacterium sp. TA1]